MPDIVSRRHITPGQMGELWNHEDSRWPVSKERIAYARKVLDGEIKAPVPAEIRQGRDVFEQRLPHATTVPMHTHNLITSKQPRLKVHAGAGIEAEKSATKREAVGNALVDTTFAWRDASELLQNESMCAVVVRPTGADWAQGPEMYDDPKKGTINRKYRRDISGRSPSDDDYDDRYQDLDSSTRAYKTDLENYQATHIPVKCDVYSRSEALPINLRVEGTKLVMDGLITRRTFSALQLMKRKYIWDGMPTLLEASQGGAAADHTMFELFYCDDDGPFIAYSIDGQKTQRISRDGEQIVDTVVDLTQYGLSEIPCMWGYGWHWGVRDMDRRGVPFPWVFGPSWAGANAILSAVTYRHWATGYLGPLIKMDTQIAQALKDAGIGHLETELNRELTLKPMTTQTVSGDIQWPIAPEASNDAWKLIQALMGANAEEATPSGALGGEGPESGFDRALTLRDALNAVAQIQDTLLELTKFVGETEARIVCHMAREAKRPVVIDYNSPVPQGQGKQINRIKVSPDVFGDSYQFHAEFPRKPGENLPQAQQWMEFWKNRGMDFIEFRELAFGDESPDVSWAKILTEDYLMSDEGKAELFLGVSEYAGDQRMRDILTLKARGLTNQGGVPTGFGQGVPDPMALTGVDMGSPATSALAGIMGGAMGQAQMGRAAAAGVGAEANPATSQGMAA